MKRTIVCLFTGMSVFFLGCHETKEDAKEPLSEKDTYRHIGEEIPFETGMDWIEYYESQGSEEGRLTTYMLTDDNMLNLLASAEDLVGVAFHYGIDDSGVNHIIAIPVDESLSLWDSIPGRIFLDANTNSAISQDVAARWAENYKQSKPQGIWFHFFGSSIFQDMCALPYFNDVVIARAVSLINWKPQLLLVVYNNGMSTGRTHDGVPGTVYDASNACPPCAAR